MAKSGKAKNTRNKAKHSKLINQKKNKIKNQKLTRELKLKQLVSKINKQKNEK